MLNERRSVKALLLKGDFLMPRKYWLLLFTAAVALLFAGNGSLLITDSVESNYALTAKEMVLSGNWLSPQIYGHYWYDKPIFFYWLTALAYKMLYGICFTLLPGVVRFGQRGIIGVRRQQAGKCAQRLFQCIGTAEQCRIFSDQQVGNYRCCIVLFLQCDIAVFLSWLS